MQINASQDEHVCLDGVVKGVRNRSLTNFIIDLPNRVSAAAIVCLVTLTLFGSCSQPPNTIRGDMKGASIDTLLVILIPLDNLDKRAISDTLIANNGRFEYKFPDEGAYDLLIRAPRLYKLRSNGELYIPENSVMHIYVEQGDQIRFEGYADSTGFRSVKLSGSKLNADYSIIQNQLYEIFEHQFDNATALDKATADSNQKEITTVRAKIRDQYIVRDKLYVDYVQSNLDNPLSALLLCMKSIDSIGLYYDQLGENAINSIFSQRLEREMEKYSHNNSAAIVGGQVQDFTLEDISGKQFSLSSLLGRDKYVIIDFWGSWCGPCVAGMPKMKSIYERYKTKLEIVGVACNEPSTKVWRDAVKQHELPWINTYTDSKSNVNVQYGIKAYPTKIVVNPKGEILIKEEGEAANFYTKLEALLR